MSRPPGQLEIPAHLRSRCFVTKLDWSDRKELEWMNTARLARKWTESAGDYGRMAVTDGERTKQRSAQEFTQVGGMTPFLNTKQP
jgi:hypothetical protein